MTKFSRFAPLAFAAIMTVSMSSCNDDDNNRTLPDGPNDQGSGVYPALDQVFPNGEVTSVGDMTITRDNTGRPTRITDATSIVDFTYAPVSRTTQYDMTMRVTNRYNTRDVETYYLQLNLFGYISYALEVDDDNDYETWEFEYNTDGQMTKMRRSDGDRETTTLTYANGDITAVETSSRKDRDRETVQYTDQTVLTPIDNLGNIMLFDKCFNVDLDELELAYYAGLLGKSTRHLPVLITETDARPEYETFTWTLNQAGKPTSLLITEYESNYSAGRPQPLINFTW